MAVFGVAVSTAVATWCFLIGGYVAYYLPAGMGTAVMIAGGLVGILLIFLAVVPACTRYGIDSVVSTTPQLGERGSYFSVLLAYVTLIGWNTVLLIFIGRAGGEILITLGVFGEGARDVLVVVLALASTAAVWWLLRGGPERLRNVGPWIAGMVLLLGAWVFVLLITQVGWSDIVDAEPSAASPDKLWNYTTGFELLVVSALSWWPYVGGMVRHASGTRKALWPAVVGLSLPLSIVSLIGLYSGLAVPDSAGDPTTFLVDLGGTFSGIVALLFIVLANIGTTMVGVYAVTLGVRQVPAVRKLSWTSTLGLSLIPVAVIIIVIPNYFFDNIGTLLAFMGVLFAPMCGMQIVDYFVFRKQRLDVRGLFRRSADAPYRFWGGFNPAGFAALAAGFVTYIWLLDPVDYTSRSPYEYLSASLPSAVVAGAVFWAVTQFVVIPLGRGGYARPVQDVSRSVSGEAREGAVAETERVS